MKQVHFHALFLAGSLWLAGCAVNPYRPYDGDGGYSEVNVAKTRWEVSFSGDKYQSESDAKNYALVRAAQIGKANNFKYLRIEGAKAHEQKDSETYTQTQTVPDSYYGPTRRRGFWGASEQEESTVTRVVKSPDVRLVVDFQNEDCDDCLSVDQKLAEASAQGVLK